jgi:hypothetical protein
MMANMKMNMTLPFVIQKHHEGRVFHWDLMLHRPVEGAGPNDRVLATWQLTVEPVAENLTTPIVATAIPDHRRIYLEYEGPISNDRGRCEIVDRGQYELIEYRADLWRVRLMGQRLVGTFELKKNMIDESWTLAKWCRTE